jgi:hypothetical protein
MSISSVSQKTMHDVADKQLAEGKAKLQDTKPVLTKEVIQLINS